MGLHEVLQTLPRAKARAGPPWPSKSKGFTTTAKSRPLIWGHSPGPTSTSTTWLGWGRKTTAQQNLDYLRWCYPVVQHGPWCTFTQHKELEAKHSSAGFCIAPAGHSPHCNLVSFKQAQIHCSVDFKRDYLVFKLYINEIWKVVIIPTDS